MKTIEIYTDGACSENPGYGGWGAVIIEGDNLTEISGSSKKPTTSNRAEMIAVIKALETLREPCKVTVYSDSQLVVRGMNEWILGWMYQGWKTAKKKPVVNKDLWERLVEAQIGHWVSYVWVKAHSGHPHNERANTLAQNAIQH